MPPKFDAGSGNEDILWMGEAIDQGMIKKGDVIPVQSIRKANSGKGFTITGLHESGDIVDFVWAKSQNGKILTAAFADPHELYECKLDLIAQKDRKNAAINCEELVGAYWEVDSEGDLVFMYNGAGEPSVKTTKPRKLSGDRQ